MLTFKFIFTDPFYTTFQSLLTTKVPLDPALIFLHTPLHVCRRATT